jgi:hypothetical protein
MLAAAGGCMTVSPPAARQVVIPAFDVSQVRSVAVVEFENRSKCASAGKQVADFVEQLLVAESGYSVVCRMDLEWIRAEHDLVLQGEPDPQTVRNIGRVAGVDAIVVGAIDTYSLAERQFTPLRVARRATVGFRAKLLQTSTGQVLWSRHLSGEFSWKGWLDGRRVCSVDQCMREALSECAHELREMYPHTASRRVRAPGAGAR